MASDNARGSPERAGKSGWTWAYAALAAIACALAIRAVYLGSHAKYFRRIRVDARHAVAGMHPLSPGFARKTSSYRFSYGLDGRLKSVKSLWHGEADYDSALGAARLRIRYAPDGESRSWEDAEGRPASRNGAAGERLSFDPRGRSGSLSNYDAQGEPVEDWDGVARRDWTLDGAGRIVKAVRLDLHGSPVTDKKGYRETRYAYDATGYLVEQSNQGPDGRPLADKYGVATVRWRRDPAGDAVETAYSGADGKPRGLEGAGIAVLRSRYDERGDAARTDYFGANGRPREGRDGVASILSRYDEDGHLVERRYLGADGRLKKAAGRGAAVMRWQYDGAGRIVKELSFDTEGNVVERHDYLGRPQLPSVPPLY